MSIEVTIDSREERLIKVLDSSEMSAYCGHMYYNVQNLDVGDVIYKHGDQLMCLIERKTWDDYATSITDGRLKNQAIRIDQLCHEYPQMTVIYLVEGASLSMDHKFRGGVTRDAVYSSMVNRVLRDHFMVYRSMSLEDTALIVTKIYDKLSEMITRPDRPDKPENIRIDYLKTIKLSKKENMTPQNCYVCQLAQIPGVSIDMAIQIESKYPSICCLIDALRTGKETLLCDLMIPVANDKNRRLGSVLSRRIYEYLCQPPPPPPPSPPAPVPRIKLTLKC
jgi:ERCC4-type nuclease